MRQNSKVGFDRALRIALADNEHGEPVPTTILVFTIYHFGDKSRYDSLAKTKIKELKRKIEFNVVCRMATPTETNLPFTLLII